MNQDAAGVAVADHASGDDGVDANGAGGQISKIHDGRAFLDHIFFLFLLYVTGSITLNRSVC